MIKIDVNVDGVMKPMLLQKDFYLKNGNIALRLYAEDENGDVSLYKTLTTNLSDKLPPFAVYVKDYGENEGVFD